MPDRDRDPEPGPGPAASPKPGPTPAQTHVPHPPRTAAEAIDLLTAYLPSSAAATPNPQDPRTRLDSVVYWRVNTMPGPAAAYDAFRHRPHDGALRTTMTRLLTDGINAEPDFAAELSSAVGNVNASITGTAANASSPAPNPPPGQPFHPSAWPPPARYTLVAVADTPPPLNPAESQPARRIRRRPRVKRLVMSAAVLAIAAGTASLAVALDVTEKGGPGHYTFADDPTTDPNGQFELLDWNTDPDGTVTGTVRIIDPNDPGNNETAAFTGAQHGTDIAFNPQGETDPPTLSLTGKIKGTTLTLKATDQSTTPGAIRQTALQATTQTAFDQQVSQYKARHPAGVMT